MLEGTTLSEGRGTTRPLELFGAPDIDARAILDEMQALAPLWLAGCRLRECWFEPTFHKHTGKLCNGIHIHVEDSSYQHADFSHGACKRSPSRRFVDITRNIRCGAVTPTNMSTTGWLST